MRPKITFIESICKRCFAGLRLKKTALTVLLFCGMVYTSFGQTRETHEDSTIVLEKSAFTVNIVQTLDGLLKLELVNNLGWEIGPFFLETYVTGYTLNESHIEQSLNNILLSENIEKVFGPQFMGLGINALPAFGNYKTTFAISGSTNEAPSLSLRVYGTRDGKPVYWSSTFNFN